jgi:hypothetical protein
MEEQETPEIASAAQLPTFADVRHQIEPPQGATAPEDEASAADRKKAYKREWARKKKRKSAVRDRVQREESTDQMDLFPEPECEQPPVPQFTGGDLQALVSIPMNMMCDRFNKPHLTESEEVMLAEAVAGVANKYAPFMGAYSVELTLAIALGSIVIVRLPLKTEPKPDRPDSRGNPEPETAAAVTPETTAATALEVPVWS